MRVWTNGEVHLVLDGHGLTRFAPAGTQRIPAQPTAHGFDRLPLAVSPNGNCIWARATGAVSFFRLSPWAPRVTSALAATFRGDDHAVAIVDRNGERTIAVREVASIVKNEWPPEWDTFAEFFTVPSPTKVEWPAASQPGRIWKKPPFSKSSALSPSWEWSANEFGLAGADNETGIVVGWFANDSKPSFALRVPAEHPETDIHASLTRDGVVVAHGGGRSSGGINAFARDGKHRGGFPIQGLASPIVVRGREFFVATERTDFTSRLDVKRYAIDGISELECVETALLATNGYPALDVSPDAKTILVGDGVAALRLRRNAKGVFESEQLDTTPAPVREEAPAKERAPAVESAPREPTRVRHKTFGVGTIVARSGNGESLKYDIDFTTAGRKTLMARFVELID